MERTLSRKATLNQLPHGVADALKLCEVTGGTWSDDGTTAAATPPTLIVYVGGKGSGMQMTRQNGRWTEVAVCNDDGCESRVLHGGPTTLDAYDVVCAMRDRMKINGGRS